MEKIPNLEKSFLLIPNSTLSNGKYKKTNAVTDINEIETMINVLFKSKYVDAITIGARIKTQNGLVNPPVRDNKSTSWIRS